MAEQDHEKPGRSQSTWLRLCKRILLSPITLLILIFFLLEDLFLTLLRPIVRVLGQLAPFLAIGRWLRALSPYQALFAFLVPLVLLEPVKVFSLFWIGIGHFVSGALLLIGSYVLSLLIVERMFHVTRDKLLSIGWFAWCFGLVMGVRNWAYARLRSSLVWRLTYPVFLRASLFGRMIIARCVTWLTRLYQAIQ